MYMTMPNQTKRTKTKMVSWAVNYAIGDVVKPGDMAGIYDGNLRLKPNDYCFVLRSGGEYTLARVLSCEYGRKARIELQVDGDGSRKWIPIEHYSSHVIPARCRCHPRSCAAQSPRKRLEKTSTAPMAQEGFLSTPRHTPTSGQHRSLLGRKPKSHVHSSFQSGPNQVCLKTRSNLKAQKKRCSSPTRQRSSTSFTVVNGKEYTEVNGLSDDNDFGHGPQHLKIDEAWLSPSNKDPLCSSTTQDVIAKIAENSAIDNILKFNEETLIRAFSCIGAPVYLLDS